MRDLIVKIAQLIAKLLGQPSLDSLDWRDYAARALDRLRYELREQRLSPEHEAMLRWAMFEVTRANLQLASLPSAERVNSEAYWARRDALNRIGGITLMKGMDARQRVADLSDQASQWLLSAAWTAGKTGLDLVL